MLITASLLTDEQLEQMGKIKIALEKIQEAADRVNTMSNETGLPLQSIPSFSLGQMANDISNLVFAHNLALAHLQSEAVERMKV